MLYILTWPECPRTPEAGWPELSLVSATKKKEDEKEVRQGEQGVICSSSESNDTSTESTSSDSDSSSSASSNESLSKFVCAKATVFGPGGSTRVLQHLHGEDGMVMAYTQMFSTHGALPHKFAPFAKTRSEHANRRQNTHVS